MSSVSEHGIIHVLFVSKDGSTSISASIMHSLCGLICTQSERIPLLSENAKAAFQKQFYVADSPLVRMRRDDTNNAIYYQSSVPPVKS